MRVTHPPLSRTDTLIDCALLRASEAAEDAYFRFRATDGTEDYWLTNYQLDLKARAIGAHLQKLGVGPGDPVLVVYNSCLEPVVGFLGALYAGAIAVPVCSPKAHFSARMCRIFQDTGARICLTDTKTLGVVQQSLQNADGSGVHFVATDQVSEAEADCWRRPSISAEDLAVLQYTSGSTSEPRGVMLSHSNLLRNAQFIVDRFGLTREMCGVSWLPWYHDMGLVGGFIIPLYVGAPCWLLSPWHVVQSPIKWLQAISDCGAAISGGPNFIYDLCVERAQHAELPALDLTCWKIAFNGGEPVHSQTLRNFTAKFASLGFPADAFCPCYGLAETALFVTGGPKDTCPTVKSFRSAPLRDNRVEEATNDECPVQDLVSCGRNGGPPEIVIVDPASSTRCGAGVVGEIWVQSPSNGRGYWNRPAETEETFRARLSGEPQFYFLRTGDLGFLCDGELYVTGRIKDLIIIRGENHYPQDIERTIAGCHTSLQPHGGAAFSVAQDRGERLVVLQEIRRSSRRGLVSREIIAAIRTAIAEQHGLEADAVVLLKPASLPRTSSGKVQRHVCRNLFLQGRLPMVDSWRAERPCQLSLPAPHCSEADAPDRVVDSLSVESWIRDWLTQRLDATVSSNRRVSFAELGIDSMAAVELAQALQTRFRCTLAPTALWSFPTIDALSAHVADSLLTRTSVAEDELNQVILTALDDSPDVNVLSDSDLAALVEREMAALKERRML